MSSTGPTGILGKRSDGLGRYGSEDYIVLIKHAVSHVTCFEIYLFI